MSVSATKLVKQIREALAAGGADVPVETLATEYARAAHEAAQRLESCAAMIAKGSDYQALQLAETEPALLDLIATLSFAEAREWGRFCTAERLPVAPPFDAKAVQALDSLYAKGISANHPLYKDYRSAVSSRDDARALRIIRSIARLNPEDANARAELARWENKHFQIKLQDLRTALDRVEEDPILRELGELERLSTPAKLAELPEFTRADGIRRQAARRDAMALCEKLAGSLAEERRAGGWRMVGDLLARILGLQAEHKFELAPAESEICAEMRRYYEEQRVAAAEMVRFQEALRLVESLAGEIETRLLNRSTLTISEADGLYLEFHRRWKDVEQFGRVVPDEFIRRVGATASALRTEVDRLQRRRYTKLGMAAATAVAILGTAGWFAVRAYRVQDYSNQLARLRQAGQVEAVEKMDAHLRKDQPAFAERPALRARLDEMDRWTRDERERQAETETRLGELERTAGVEFRDADLMAISNQLATAAELLGSLPAGLRATSSDRLTVVRNQFDAYLASTREKLAAQAEAELSALETLAGAQLGYDQPEEAITKALTECEPRLKALEERAQPALPALELSPAQQARVSALRARADLFENELGRLKSINEALLQAKTLEAYREALAAFKESRLTQSAQVSEARKMMAPFPKPDEILRSLVLPGDPAAWVAAKSDATGEAFVPANVQPVEITRLLALRDDLYLNDIWDVTFVDYAQKRVRREVYSRREMKKDGPRSVGEGSETTSWTGDIYDPSTHKETPAFERVSLISTTLKYGSSGTGEVTGTRLSPESRCLARLELNRMTNATGERFEKPLLRVFDELAHEKEAHPLFKAFVAQQLAEILGLRPNAWGLQYCPSLRSDLSRLAGICAGSPFRSQDWLIERKRSLFSPRLAPFFAALQSRAYFDEARLRRQIVRAALKAGLQFGGYLDGDLRPRVLPEAPAGKALWAVRADGGGVGRYQPPAKENTAGGETSGAKFARFSPLFFVPVDRDALMAEAGEPGGSGLKASFQDMPLLEP